MHGPHVRRMILELGDPDREVPVVETFHEQTDEELTEKEVKQMEANDQAIQIIFMGLPKDIYAKVDSFQNPGIQNVGNQNGLIVVPGIANPNENQIGNGNVVVARAEGNGNVNNRNQIWCYNCRGLGHLARNCTSRPRKRDVAYLQTQLLIAQKEEVGIQL
ncbi:ribonuclease H-like domain-containing protein [Tanacetum coccineum]